MGLYQELGIGHAGSADQIRDLLNQAKDQYEEQRKATAIPEEAEHAWKMVQDIDHLLNVLSQVKDAVSDVTLPLETICCALDYEVSEYPDLEDSVIWVCTHRMFKSDYRNIVGFLESVHADALADDWRTFAQNSMRAADHPEEPKKKARKAKKNVQEAENAFSAGAAGPIPDDGRTDSQSDPRRSPENHERRGASYGHGGQVPPDRHDRRDERGRKRDRRHEDLDLESENKRSLGEVILVIAIIVMAILIIGGLFLIWRARRQDQTTEQAAQAALSESTSSGLISTASTEGGAEGDGSADGGTADAAADNVGSSESAEAATSASSQDDTGLLLDRMADYTILSDETVFPLLNEVSCSNSTATSVLTGDSGRTYGTDYLFDNDMSTSWQEGESDDGVGQSLTFTFDNTAEIRAIALWIGSESSNNSYLDSNRPSDITVSITCGDLSNEQEMTLDDIDGEQMIVFDEPIPTDSLTITIDGVYKGRQFRDTAISEMKFYTE